MAITATLSSTESSVESGQPVGFTIVISNSGGSDVSVTTLVNTATGSANVSQVQFPPQSTTTVPAAGSLTLGYQDRFFASAQPSQASFACDVSAVITTSDGSVTVPTNTCTVQVAAPGIFTPWALGQFRFDALQDSYMIAIL